MHSKGYAGGTGGDGGTLGWEGAMRLQWFQFVREAVIAGVCLAIRQLFLCRQSWKSHPDVLSGGQTGHVGGVKVV